MLNNVRDYVVRSLTKEQASVNDGMDISLCRFHPETLKLEWSGANNPLWIFRESEIVVLHPDKQPVGKFEHRQPFTTHTVQLQAGDLLLLFSDGFADQFGGPKGKKFKYAALRELAEINRHLPVNELGVLLERTFFDWKGGLEQTDDVCIMIVRIPTT